MFSQFFVNRPRIPEVQTGLTGPSLSCPSLRLGPPGARCPLVAAGPAAGAPTVPSLEPPYGSGPAQNKRYFCIVLYTL